MSSGPWRPSLERFGRGERLANAALGGVYKRAIAARAPSIHAAVCAGEDTVVLDFGDVGGRMDTLDVTSTPFRVEDSAGIVPIAAACILMTQRSGCP